MLHVLTVVISSFDRATEYVTLCITVPSVTTLSKKTNRRGPGTEMRDTGHLAASGGGRSLKFPLFQFHFSRRGIVLHVTFI